MISSNQKTTINSEIESWINKFICQSCGIESHTKHIEFWKNTGGIIMHETETIKGNLCRSCIKHHFWDYTIHNLAFGWWGLKSFITTPFFIFSNIFYYIKSLKLEPVSIEAKPPVLTDDIINKLNPFIEEIIKRITHGDKIESLVNIISTSAKVSPGQVILYIRFMLINSVESS